MWKPLSEWMGGFVRPPKEARLGIERRTVLAAGIAGLGGGLLFRIQPLASKRTFNPPSFARPGRSPKAISFRSASAAASA